MSSDGLSYVKYFSREEGGSCGYCKSSNGCERHGLWAHRMSVDDYQQLIDRGWRRSGQYLYKPVMPDTCCPMYTIRCKADEFRPSKSQKRLMKRVNKYVLTGEKCRAPPMHLAGGGNPTELHHDMDASSQLTNQLVPIEVEGGASEPCEKTTTSHVKPIEIATTVNSKSTAAVAPRDPSQRSLFKAKQIRIAKKLDKLKKQGLSDEEISKRMIAKKRYPVAKALEEFIVDEPSNGAAHRLEVKLVRSNPRSSEFNDSYNASFRLFERYQVGVHKDPPGKITHQSYQRFLVTSPLETRLLITSSPEFDDYFPLHASLFAKYQAAVHKEPLEDNDETTFRLFLVDSPLQARGPYGSFHQQYWLDGVLIGVGVIDILPKCVSSVYYFYDPDYSFLGLGTYGALRELRLVRTYMKSYPELSFYYMGFYIRSCPKMRYKAQYHPSYLLCPEVYTWHSLSSCVPKLDSSKYARLNEDESAIDTEAEFSINNILALHGQQLIRIGQLRPLSKGIRDLLKEYVSLVGRACAEKMVFCTGSGPRDL